MTRIVKEHDIRRGEIIASAQKLFYTKGYEQTSVRNIIDDVGIAKGTFYHYFDAKITLLEALIEQMMAFVAQTLEAISNEPLPAIPKLLKVYSVLGNWKAGKKAQMLVIMRALYSDDNILLMHKMRAKGIAVAAPVIGRIITQGIEEGVFETDFVEDSAELFIANSNAFGDAFSHILLNPTAYNDPVAILKRKKAATETAIERLLGAAPKSLPLFNPAIIDEWFRDN